jgi:hypothetical protein
MGPDQCVRVSRRCRGLTFTTAQARQALSPPRSGVPGHRRRDSRTLPRGLPAGRRPGDHARSSRSRPTPPRRQCLPPARVSGELARSTCAARTSSEPRPGAITPPGSQAQIHPWWYTANHPGCRRSSTPRWTRETAPPASFPSNAPVYAGSRRASQRGLTIGAPVSHRSADSGSSPCEERRE